MLLNFNCGGVLQQYCLFFCCTENIFSPAKTVEAVLVALLHRLCYMRVDCKGKDR